MSISKELKKTLKKYLGLVKIVQVELYFKDTRGIKVGKTYPVVAISNECGVNKDQTGYLILIEREDMPDDYLTMYHSQVWLIEDEKNN